MKSTINESTKEQKYEFLADDPKVKVMPILIALIIGSFFTFLNETLLNIALTTLMKEFSISVTTVQWMATGFMLVMGIVVPVSAVLMQWFTTRQLYLGTLIVFTLGTLICSAAPNFPILLTGRLLQAAGTGLLMPIVFNVFLLMFPPKRRGAIMGMLGLVFMFAPAIGPTLSGVIVEYLGWRFLFISVLPFMAISLLFGYKYLINVSEVTRPRIDVLSVLLSSTAFGGIVYGFSSAGESEKGFLTPLVYISIIVGTIALIWFTLRQLKLKEPLINMRVFKYPMFTLSVLLFVIVIMAMFSSEIILPIYMQGPLALTAATAGLILLPGSLLSGVLSPVTGFIFDKFGPRVLMIPATIILAATLFMMSKLSMDTPIWMLVTGYMLLMLAISAIMMPAETNGLNQLPKSLYPHGTAVMTTLQPVAGAVGVSIFISIMTARQTSLLEKSANPEDQHTILEAMVGGVELVYLIAFALAVVACVISFFVYRAVPEKQDDDEAQAVEGIQEHKAM